MSCVEEEELRQGEEGRFRATDDERDSDEERQHLFERRRDLVETVRNQRGQSKPNHMVACRFSEAELEHVCVLLCAKCDARSRNSADDTAAPLKPNDAEKDVFHDFATRRQRPSPRAVPWWCRRVPFFRARFSGVAFRDWSSDADTWWLLMYAKNTPFTVHVSAASPLWACEPR